MITLKNVSVAFASQPVLLQVNLHVGAGEFISLVGETGVGKTTLLRLIYFDVMPDEGTVIVNGRDSSTIRRSEIPMLRRTIGIAFQDYKLLDDRTVFQNIVFALEVTGTPRSEMTKRVLRVLADVGLSHKRDNLPLELSGGEQQRVVIARALVNEPQVLLADEPTGNLDLGTSLEILEILKAASARGTCVVLATHNYELVRRAGGRIVQIRDCRVGEIDRV